MAMAAGTAGTTPALKDALAGKDILIRKAIPVKIYQTKRNATVRAAQAMHLSEWIFGIPLRTTPQPQPGGGQHETSEVTEFESVVFPGLYSQSESEPEEQLGKIGTGTSQHVTNTQEVPFRWICAIETATIVTESTRTRTSPLKRVATGILISPCHVLTAAHVIKSAQKDERNIVVSEEEATAAEVIPALDGSSKPPFGKFKVKSWVLHPKWNPRVEDAKTDCALLTLEKCVEYPSQKNPSPGFWRLEIPPSSARAALIGGDVVTAGYPESKNNEMWCFTGKGTTGSTQSDASILQSKNAEKWVQRNPTFFVTADAEHGQSGSPVWVKQQDRISLVGVLVKANTTSNQALAINEEVVNLLQSWMAPSGPAHETQTSESLAGGWLQSEIENAHTMSMEAPFVGQREISRGEIGEALESLEEFEDKPPRGLVLLDHMHVPKTLDPKASGGFKIGTTAIVMKPSAMNPGFIDEHDEVVTNRGALSLQTCLDSTLTGQFSKFLARKGAIKADARDRVRVALVDLTGPKLSQPEFAGWGSTVAMYGASSPKMLAVYAAFQLRKDLRQMAEDQAIPTGRELAAFALKTWKEKNLRRDLPNLTWLFDIEKWSAKPDDLNFSAAAHAAFAKIVENDSASLIIRQVGFPYIASVAWQSGLRHPMRGGLWLSRAYDGGGGWADNPAMKATAFVHNITALSVVTFYTLLAQGRLVDDASSTEITAVLRDGCPTCLLPPEIVLEATKCGVFKPFLHDCILAHHGGARYAAAILTEINATWPDPTKCPTGEETVDYTNLCRTVDRLLVGNQSSAKTQCE
jgi:V8-like Glu-specific endopeptidase